jgi:hypothetical protein
MDLYLRQENPIEKEVASFINTLRNYKSLKKDTQLLKSDYTQELELVDVIALINNTIKDTSIEHRERLIFDIIKMSEDRSFRDPNQKTGDLYNRRGNLPGGKLFKSIASVRFDFIDQKWYVIYEPTDNGKWAGGLKYNPYTEWSVEKFNLLQKYQK